MSSVASRYSVSEQYAIKIETALDLQVLLCNREGREGTVKAEW